MFNRRHRHFNPGDAGAKFALDSRFKITFNDGDPVGSWNDRTINGNNATKAGSSRPLYKISQQGGNPAIRFDNIDDSLSLPSMNIVGTFLPSFFVVAKMISGWKPMLAQYSSQSFILSMGNLYGSFYKIFAKGWNVTSTNDGSLCQIQTFLQATPTSWKVSKNSILSDTFTTSSFGSNSSSYATTIGDYSSGGNAVHGSADISAMCLLPFLVSDSLKKRIEHSLAMSFKINI